MPSRGFPDRTGRHSFGCGALGSEGLFLGLDISFPALFWGKLCRFEVPNIGDPNKVP